MLNNFKLGYLPHLNKDRVNDVGGEIVRNLVFENIGKDDKIIVVMFVDGSEPKQIVLKDLQTKPKISLSLRKDSGLFKFVIDDFSIVKNEKVILENEKLFWVLCMAPEGVNVTHYDVGI